MAAKKKTKKKVSPKTKTKKVVAKAKKKVAPKKVAPKKKAAAKKAAPKKAAPKKAAAKKAAPAKVATKVKREDRAGHLNPTYAKQLRKQSGKSTKSDQTRPAFKVEDDDVAEDLGEEVVGKANSGEDEGEEVANAEYTEEVGGPFVVTTGGEEFAEGTDASNPEGADVEPFPKT
ncbi:MAG TPA: hypothetical protein VH054_00320 [Polyangiaceae bacterium]|nr:hypothetical protein [Polyangiaceae bacterium]